MILFFDEFHNAANQEHSILEQLKTDLLERNFRCIMATTNDEYETSIRPNAAFVSRTKSIDILPLNSDETKNLIRQSVVENPHPIIEVMQETYDAILEIGEQHPIYKTRYNPRKSIQIFSAVMAAASQWRPTQLNDDLKKVKLQEDLLQLECNEKNRNKDWSRGPEGQEKIGKLRAATAAFHEVERKINLQLQQYNQIKLLQECASKYESERKTLIHQLAEQEDISPETQKRYLYTKFVLLPSVHQLLQEKIKEFENNFHEKIPLQIDAAFVRAQFPFTHS